MLRTVLVQETVLETVLDTVLQRATSQDEARARCHQGEASELPYPSLPLSLGLKGLQTDRLWA